MRQQAIPATTLEWIIKFGVVLAMFAALNLASPLRAEEPGCPVQVGEGVLCTGPQQIQFDYLPLIQSSPAVPRPCPYPVGEGVLCTGPDVPAAGGASGSPLPAGAPNTASTAAPAQQALFIPLLGG